MTAVKQWHYRVAEYLWNTFSLMRMRTLPRSWRGNSTATNTVITKLGEWRCGLMTNRLGYLLCSAH